MRDSKEQLKDDIHGPHTTQFNRQAAEFAQFSSVADGFSLEWVLDQMPRHGLGDGGTSS